MRYLHFLAAMLVVSSLPARELTEETFERWFAYLLPKESELTWRRIGWRGTLKEAMLEAREKDMPILFWAMNGHPLACT
jgi:hypothetical protein